MYGGVLLLLKPATLLKVTRLSMGVLRSVPLTLLKANAFEIYGKS